MKTVVLLLVLVVVVLKSEALKCNCGGTKQCSNPVETCYGSSDVCATVIIYAGSTVRYFKSCMSSANCFMMNQPGVSTAVCCSTDLCNR